MSAELSTVMVDSFTSPSNIAVENACESMYRLILEALINGTAREAAQQFIPFYERADRLAEYLGLTEQAGEAAGGETEPDSDAAFQFKSYYFGQMKAATDLLADVARLEKERESSQGWSRRSKHLGACLTIVGGNPGIPGTELKKQLCLSGSGFSNFMKRVESLHLFYVQKDGNTKYYTLSPRGRRFLQSSGSMGSDSKKLYDEKFILLLLKSIADEMSESKPSAAHVILQANLRREDGVVIGTSQLLKKQIRQIFEARDAGRKNFEMHLYPSVKKKDIYYYIDQIPAKQSIYPVYESICDTEWR